MKNFCGIKSMFLSKIFLVCKEEIMKLRKKILFTIGIFLLVIFLYEVVNKYQYIAHLSWQLPSIGQLSKFIPFFYFYGGIALIMGLILYALYFWFYLEHFDLLMIREDKKGKLQLKSSAIESYVQHIIAENRWLDNAKVKTRIKADTIYVDIIGDLRRTSGITERSDLLVQKIEADLKTFLGINKEISTEITFQDTANQKTDSAPTSRRVQ